MKKFLLAINLLIKACSLNIIATIHVYRLPGNTARHITNKKAAFQLLYVMFLASGVLSPCLLNIVLKPLMPEAANVLIGPADIEFTLIPFEPSVEAKYLTLASRLAFAILTL